MQDASCGWELTPAATPSATATINPILTRRLLQMSPRTRPVSPLLLWRSRIMRSLKACEWKVHVTAAADIPIEGERI